MDYKEKYEQALEKMKAWAEGKYPECFDSAQKTAELIFPELKESGDEKIRKVLIEYFNRYKEQEECGVKTFYGISTDDILAWLKKQEEIKIPKWLFDFLEECRPYIGCALGYDERRDIEGKVVAVQKWLEKQGEQKPVDKAEPKFNDGDWVVSPNGVYWHIDAIRDGRYQVSSDSGDSADWPLDTNIYHRFNIQDAKDGDVLAFDDDTIVLFKDLYNKTSFHSYCHIEDGVFTVSEEDVPDWWPCRVFKPATKEQRDLLFQKMKEAGYEWNDEKKELRKIESDEPDVLIEESYQQQADDIIDIVAEKSTKSKEDDKIEPMFHKGEWIIDKQGIVHQIANVIENVTNHTYGYDIVGGGYFNDNTEGVRLWTIKDAKDGDVLAINDRLAMPSICIFSNFSGLHDKYATLLCHCGVQGLERNLNVNGYHDDSLGYVPATKEQCDLLFQKMKEAGYEWDADTKELKKIEQEYHCTGVREPKEATGVLKQLLNKENPAWSVEDKSKVQRICKYLDEAKKYYADITEVRECIDYLKSLKDRVQPQPKQEWSEEDIEMINWLIRCCEKEHEELCNDRYGHQEIVSDLKRDCRKKWDWLESLKNKVVPQNTWKPSEENNANKS